MQKKIFSITFFIIFLILASSAWAKDFFVQTPVTSSSIRNACQTAFNNVATGPHNVIIPDGKYGNLGTITIDSTWDGQSSKKLILKSESGGGVTFSGNTVFLINADYWIIRDLVFDNVDIGTHTPAIKLTGDNIRVTDNEFKNSGHTSYKFYAVYIDTPADYAEVDHNYIHDWAGRGVLVYNVYGSFAPHVHHNYFKDFPSKAYDDSSAVFLNGGLSGTSDYEMNAIIEYNIFERCFSDPETISVKTSNNIIRYNVFLDTNILSLRHGDDTLVYNNWFFRTDTNLNMQALQVSGKGHKIINNYFQGLGGASKTVSFMGGAEIYEQIESCLFESNTFAYCTNGRILQFGSGKPQTVTLKNNIVYNSGGGYIVYNANTSAVSITWTENIFYTTGTYYSGTAPGGSWPSDSSNANQLTVVEFSSLWNEYTNNEYGDLYVVNSAFKSQPIGLTEPLSKVEVGPTWMNPIADNIIGPPVGLTIITN